MACMIRKKNGTDNMLRFVSLAMYPLEKLFPFDAWPDHQDI